ncbi:hypothetical protein Btru_045545 [Bulinus truncatus]|nr:hypothetical protein Btru_045545 [Bulinus truncatus]
MFLKLTIFFTFGILNIESKSKGCTGRPLFANKPYVVVWNHPSVSCESKGDHINFEKWGIVDNEGDKFIGEQISLFYNLGSFPSYHGNLSYNGGIPQLANKTYHLYKTQADIKATLINANYSGLAVIDFENWRPLFSLNFDALSIYQKKSLELAKERFPSYNKDQLLQVATQEFEDSARSILEKTLSLANYLRPNGSWGYYGYPRCWDSYCNDSTITINNRLSWIYSLSTGLYPSIYFNLDVPPSQRAERIHMVVKETLRLKATWSPPDVLLLPYASSQSGPYSMFNASDLYFSIRLPADMGASGVVLWGSSEDMRAKNECQILQQYVNTTLGPYALDVTNFFSNCSANNCNGNGRCVKKDLEAYFQQHLWKKGKTECCITEDELKWMERPVKDNLSSQQSGSESSQFFKSKREGDPKVFQYFEAEKVFSGAENPEDLKLLDIPTKRTVDDFLVYDYGNYVCKCLSGWSGIHCDEKVI